VEGKKIMGTSSAQDREFIDKVIGAELLENAIDWIAKNMDPEDVFPDSKLEFWAIHNGFIKEE
jgi:hypothetical protein